LLVFALFDQALKILLVIHSSAKLQKSLELNS
jgi:hypothetical protein